jgi:hypothetical protein
VTHFVGANIRYVEITGADPVTKDAALAVLVCEKLGAGVFRDVYALRGRDDVVLKVEDRGGEFCNVMEWKLWTDAQGTPAEKWLAPCLDLSGVGGRALVMKRTKPMSQRAWDKLEIPSFFNDVKIDNWGLYEGRPVCHDYSHTRVFLRGMRVGKLVRASR